VIYLYFDRLAGAVRRRRAAARGAADDAPPSDRNPAPQLH
jgi:hypothetical protein